MIPRLPGTAGGIVVLTLLISVVGTSLAAAETQRPATGSAPPRKADVVVLGGSSAGVGAAIAAARGGAEVLLIEETDRLGGMMSNGVCRTDLGRPGSSSGLFEEFRRKAAAHYEARGQLKESNSGLIYEPDVADGLLKQMVVSTSGIETLWGYYLAETGGVQKDGNRIARLLVENGRGQSLTLAASVFIDATDTGDILGQAGKEDVDWTYGREPMTRYNEPHNGHIYVDPSNQARIGGTGEGDRLIQAYNYRVTWQVNGFTGYPVPPDYEKNLPLFRAVPPGGGRWTVLGKEYNGIWIQAVVPNAKLDINLDRVGINHRYPIASRAERRAIAEAHKNFALGYLHYLRTEQGLSELGLSGDDYENSGHFPQTLYVREARRLLGKFVLTENDALPEKGTDRAPRKVDSVGIGSYGMDSHCVSDTEVTTRGCEGGFWVGVAPYQIPYGVMVPRQLDGLLVPHAVSGTHVGFSTMRMEPVRMNLGQAAGTAAAMAALRDIPVGAVPILDLQTSLSEQGQMLIYLSDVQPDRPGFAAIQRLTARGIIEGLPDLSFAPDAPLSRGEMCKWIVTGLKLAVNTTGGPHFPDVPPGHPAYECIETLYNMGAACGTPDGTFRPEEPATRGQLARTAVTAAGAVYDGKSASFSDVPPTHSLRPYVEALSQRKAMTADPAAVFRPAAPSTREFGAQVVDGLTRR